MTQTQSPASDAGPHIMLIDDHPLIRDALSLAATRAEPGTRVSAVGSLVEAIENAQADKPDLFLLDLDLGTGGDLSNILTLSNTFPGVPVAVISATERTEIIRSARELGAAGYLRKSADLGDLRSAISALLNGELVFSDDLDAGGATLSERDDASRRLATLTPTQARVLAGLRSGLLNKQIAYELSISEATVKAHMTAIFRKLGVVNRTQALLVARHLDVPSEGGDTPPG